MATTVTSVIQFMSVIDNAANAIADDVKHLQRHLSDNALITADAQYFLYSIAESVRKIKEGFGE